MRSGKPNYIELVRKLSAEEQERLLSRMTGKLPRRLEKEKLSREEAMAIQMELEDEQLEEWRARTGAQQRQSGQTDKEKSDPSQQEAAAQHTQAADTGKPKGKSAVKAKKSDKAKKSV